mmetsp:Transcript_89264/g.186543  ORF Transcript_89264/g.186543 Transcript_89264/m.186543 type:complete len:371 (+) Transcript_89264:44-1156(+)
MADPSGQSRPSLGRYFGSIFHAIFRQFKATPGTLALHRGPLRPILVVAAAALLMDQLADVIQRKLIYFPTSANLAPLLSRCAAVLAPYNYEVQRISYQIRPIVSVLNFRAPYKQSALLITPASGEAGPKCLKRLWVVAGGNAMTSVDWVPFVTDLLKGGAQKDLGFLLLDYPGYLGNEGPTSAGLALRSAQGGLKTTLEHLESKGVSVEALGFLGHSLGCANMLQLAAAISKEQPERMTKEHPARLVLSAPFTSIPNMGTALFGAGVGIRAAISVLSLTSRHVWNNEQNLAQLMSLGSDHCSIHILHGTFDEIVPVTMGRQLHQQCKAWGLKTCSYKELSDVYHNDILDEAFADFARLMLSTEEQLEARL